MNLDYEKTKKAARRYRALAHGLRLQIIGLIDEAGEINVFRIYKTLEIEQSVASQHLAVLRRQGVVNARREGKKIFYTLNYEAIKNLVDHSAGLKALYQTSKRRYTFSVPQE